MTKDSGTLEESYNAFMEAGGRLSRNEDVLFHEWLTDEYNEAGLVYSAKFILVKTSFTEDQLFFLRKLKGLDI